MLISSLALQIPGLLHSWYIIAKYPEPSYEYQTVSQDSEAGGGRVTYVIVQPDGRHHHQHQPPKPQGHMTYGTTDNASGGPSSQTQNAGEGGSNGAPPPSYAQVVSGDHKVQTQE